MTPSKVSLSRCTSKRKKGTGPPRSSAAPEQLEHRLQVDEHGEEVRDRREEDRELDREDEEERHRHRH